MTKAFLDGRMAAVHGAAVRENPFKSNQFVYWQWREGWFSVTGPSETQARRRIDHIRTMAAAATQDTAKNDCLGPQED